LDIHFTVGTSTKELRLLPRKMPPQAYEASQYVVPRAAAFFSASGAAISQEVLSKI
jgi:hypothetical protein